MTIQRSATGWDSRRRRLFLMLDALLAPEDDNDRPLLESLRQLGLMPRYFYVPLDAQSFRDPAQGREKIYLESGRRVMFPEKRFALTKEASVNQDLRLFLNSLSVDPVFLGTPDGRAMAEVLALYRNSESVFKELAGKDRGRTADRARRRHLRFSQPDEAWFSGRSSWLQGVVFADLCDLFFYEGFFHPLLPSAWKIFCEGRLQAPLLRTESLCSLLFWAGREEDARARLDLLIRDGQATSSGAALLMGAMDLFAEASEAPGWFVQAEAILRQELGVRTLQIGWIPGLWINLARFLYGSQRDLRTMRGALEAALDSVYTWTDPFSFGTPGFRALGALDALRGSDRDKAVRILEEGDDSERLLDGNYLSALLHYRARQRCGMGKDDAPALRSWHGRCRDFPLLARAFADLLAAMPDLPDAEAWIRPRGCSPRFRLDRLVEDMPEWALRLRALEDLALSSREEWEGRQQRLVWVINLKDNRVSPYLQVKGKAGWSAGRERSLARLQEESGDLGWLSSQDRKIISYIDATPSWRSSASLRLSTCCEALEGCELVFEGEGKKKKPVTFRKGSPRYSVREGTDGYELSFGSQAKDSAVIGGTVFSRPEPGVIEYFKLSERERQIARVIGQGLVFPREALPRVLELTRSDLNIDMTTRGIAAERVEADPTPVLQMEQDAAGFGVVTGVRPFGRPGTAFFPVGEGSLSPLATVQADGEAGVTRTLRAVRDFDAERAALEKLLAACPVLAGGLEDRHWNTGDAEELLSLLEELRDCGVPHSVEWPKGQKIRLGASLDLDSVSVSIGAAAGDWFGVSGEVRLDEEHLVSLTELLRALQGSRFVCLGDGEYVALTAELRRRLASLKMVGMEGKKGQFLINSLASAAVEQALGDMDVQADEAWEHSVARMREAFAATPEVPALLHADLREYQREGYEWLQRLAIWGVGACLADDMGLGKTLQAIAVLLNQAAKGPCLVVAPTSVCANWESEIARFAPSLSAKRLGTQSRSETVAALAEGDVLIVGYGLLVNVQEELASRRWAMIVFDEAQALKNAATSRAKAAKRLEADFRLALTGTPIENRIDDLWSLFSIINPGLLGTWESFSRRYGSVSAGTRASRALRAVVRPFLLRRLKAAVLDELPAKTEQTIVVEPSEKELAFYESLRRGALEKIAASQSGGGKKRFEILAELTRLRRACCHPGLADPDMLAMEKESSKTLQFLETVQDLIAGGHKVLAFSQFTSYLAQIREALTERRIGFQYLDGSTPEAERRRRVAAFQQGQGDVFLLSLKAGGTGINLTAADYVIHLDPWWNPAVEDQASDRAHRIGQKRPVTIYRLVQAASVEEKILALHAVKRELAAEFLEGTETGVSSLTEEELLRLLQ